MVPWGQKTKSEATEAAALDTMEAADKAEAALIPQKFNC